ncbi:MAG: hypothetical protein E3K38_04755 [Candidatus Kuenenia stuttgartiensis]|nr:hypothetical protein [Candidatus Kuenenia stuttgartiensis]
MLKWLFAVLISIVCCLFLIPAHGFSGEGNGEYRVRPGDMIRISVLENEDIQSRMPVANDGAISFPYLGNINVGGMTLEEIKNTVTDGLSAGYIKYPVVSVTLESSESPQFFVYGEVQNPGKFILDENTTVLMALSQAGGVTPDGLYGSIKLRRKQTEKTEYEEISVNLKDENGDLSVKDEDIVIVERNKIFYVCGKIGRPGRYTLEHNMTVIKAISLAGGITSEGLYGDVLIRRQNKDSGEYEDIEINLKGYTEAGALTGNLQIMPDDVITVGENKNFFVYGEVMQPGKFVLEDNITVLKAISLAGGFSRYGSQDKVKILRQVRNKAEYESIRVDIKGAVKGSADKDIRLKPDDIVVVSEGLL